MKNFFTLCMSAALLTAASAGAVAALGSPDMQTAQAPARVAAQADGAKMYAFLPSSGAQMEARGLYSFSMNGDTPSFSFTGNKAEGDFTPVSMWQDGDQMRGFYYSDNNSNYFPTKIHTFTMTADGKLTEDADLMDVNGHVFLNGGGVYCPEDGYVYGIAWISGTATRSFVRAKADDLGNTETIMDFNVSTSISVSASSYNQKDGKFYFITNLSSTNGLYSIDKEGNRTFIRDLGNSSCFYHQGFSTGMCYNAEEDAFYYVSYPYNGQTVYGTRGILRFSGADYKTLDTMGTYPDGCYYSNLVYCEPTVSDNSPKAVSKVTWTSTGTAITVSCTLPSECTDGSAIGSFESVDIYAAGTDDKLGSATSGLTAGGDAVITIDTESLQAGAASWEIAAVANGKTGRRSSVSVWVGNDTPEAPSGLAYSQGRLTWTASETGVHGGYVAAPVTYNVYLNDVLAGSTDQTEYDINMEGKELDVYSVTVEAEAGQMKSEKSNAVEFIAGEPISLPYSLALDSESQTKLLTTFGNSSSSYYEWGWKSNYWSGETYWGTESAYSGTIDQYFALPNIRFTNSGNRYKISFEVYATVSYGVSQAGNEIGIYFGTEPDEAAMNEIVAPERIEGVSQWVKIEKDFTLPAQGTYLIALRNLWENNKYGSYDCGALRVRNISIEPVESTDKTPGAITDLKAEADANGELKANVTFTMPTEFSLGTEIPADTEIEAIVTTGENTVTVTGKPGETKTVEIETAQGDNTISVTTKVGDVTNEEAVSVNVFTGVLAPQPVAAVTLEPAAAHNETRITWEAPKAVDGSDLNPDMIEYSVMTWDAGRFAWTECATVKGETEYTYTPENTTQNTYKFAVASKNTAGKADNTESEAIFLGEALSLPLTQNFTAEELTVGSFNSKPIQQYWGAVMAATWPGIGYGNTAINCKKLSAINNAPWTADADQYGYVVDAYTTNTGRLASPFFSTDIENANAIKVSARLWAGDNAVKTTVMAMHSDMTAPEAIQEVTGTGWTSVDILLPEEYLHKPYVQIFFDIDYAASMQARKYFALTSYAVGFETGVRSISEAEGICGGNGEIIVAGHAGETVTVVTLDGRTVAVREAAETETISVAAGIYVVRTASGVKKVIVK